MHDDFSSNMRLLCRYYRSIAEVCRGLNINRSQFNRYLSGRYRPSAHTLRRFCDFFGVVEFEILLPYEQLQRPIKVRPNRSPKRPGEPVCHGIFRAVEFINGSNFQSITNILLE